MLDTVEGVCGYTVIQCIQPKSGYNADTMADTKTPLRSETQATWCGRAMPPAANPNPDRARRAASVAPAAEAKDEFVRAPLLPVRAPAAATRTAISQRKRETVMEMQQRGSS